MTPRAARRLLACHYGEANRHHSAAVSRAMRVLEKDGALAADHRRQVEFDERMGGAIARIGIPDSLDERLAGKLASLPRHKPGLRDPSMLAVAIGGFLLIAVIAWQAAGRPAAAPPGIIAIAEQVAAMDGARFEAVSLPLDGMGDWFIMQGFEGFPEKMPERLRDALVDGAAAQSGGGNPLAVMDLAGGEGRLVVFPADGLEDDDVGEFSGLRLGDAGRATLMREGAMVFLLLR